MPDLDQLLGLSDLWFSKTPSMPQIICSGVRGPRVHQNLRDLLCDVLQAIFQVPLDFDALTERLKGGSMRCNLHMVSIGSSPLSSYLEKRLAPQSLQNFGIEKPLHHSGPSTRPSTEDSIAVIGMAGKFPGAENPEELWHLLEHGKDLHQKVATECLRQRDFLVTTPRYRLTVLISEHITILPEKYPILH